MVGFYHLSLKDENGASIKDLLVAHNLLKEIDGKPYVRYIEPEDMMCLECFPEDEGKFYKYTDVDLREDGSLVWADTDGSLEFIAKQISSIITGVTFHYFEDWHDMSGTYKIDNIEYILDGNYVDENGKPCAFALGKVPERFVTIEDDKAVVRIPVRDTGKFVERSFPKEDFQKGIVYVREAQKEDGEIIYKANWDYWTYEVFLSWTA